MLSEEARKRMLAGVRSKDSPPAGIQEERKEPAEVPAEEETHEAPVTREESPDDEPEGEGSMAEAPGDPADTYSGEDEDEDESGSSAETEADLDAGAAEGLDYGKESLPYAKPLTSSGTERGNDAGPLPEVPAAAGPAARERRPRASLASLEGRDSSKPFSVRNVPMSLMHMVWRSLGDSSVAGRKALYAYLYAFRDKSFDQEIDYSDLPEDVVELAGSFDVAAKQRAFERDMSRMKEMLKEVMENQEMSLWAMVYLIWENAGLLVSRADSPEDLKFSISQQGFEETIRNISAAVDDYAKYRRYKDGRPIR